MWVFRRYSVNSRQLPKYLGSLSPFGIIVTIPSFCIVDKYSCLNDLLMALVTKELNNFQNAL